MRGRTCALITLVLAACTAKSAPSREPMPSEPVVACMRAHLEFWAWAEDRASRFLPVHSFEPLACPDLYSSPDCRAAWHALFSAPDVPEPPLARVGSVCARAYCDRLPAPKPGLCTEAGGGLLGNDRVDALIELDTAVLSLEIGVPDVAVSLAQKSRVFRTIEVPVTLPSAQPATDSRQASLRVAVAKGAVTLDGKTVTDDELRDSFRAHAESAERPSLLIRADRDVPYRRVVEILDMAMEAGVADVAFEAADPEGATPPSP